MAVAGRVIVHDGSPHLPEDDTALVLRSRWCSLQRGQQSISIGDQTTNDTKVFGGNTNGMRPDPQHTTGLPVRDSLIRVLDCRDVTYSAAARTDRDIS